MRGFMKERISLDNIKIILVRPRFPENIGSVARAMKNMNLSKLAIVNGVSPIHPNAYKLASGAEEILERAEEFLTLKEAIADLECIVATTSRTEKERNPFLRPKELAKKLVPLSQKNRIGIVFGSEKEGLTNEELSLCHLYVKIPTSETFPSLNLSQAVMILCYELFQAQGNVSKPPTSLASSEEIEKMFDHMEKTLIDIGFLEVKNPNRIMRTLRRLFGRSQMDQREVRILHGILSKVDWSRKKTGVN